MPPRRKDVAQPDADMVFGVIRQLKTTEPEVAQQLEHFFELFRGIGVPMTFAPSSLYALDEALPEIMEQLEQEQGNTEEEGNSLLLVIQLCGFWLGTMLIEQTGGGQWVHDSEEGSLLRGVPGTTGDVSPFDPFIKKANSRRVSLMKEVEKMIGLPVLALEGNE